MKIVGKEENRAPPIERECATTSWAARVIDTATSRGELCFFIPTAGADLFEKRNLSRFAIDLQNELIAA